MSARTSSTHFSPAAKPAAAWAWACRKPGGSSPPTAVRSRSPRPNPAARPSRSNCRASDAGLLPPSPRRPRVTVQHFQADNKQQIDNLKHSVSRHTDRPPRLADRENLGMCHIQRAAVGQMQAKGLKRLSAVQIANLINGHDEHSSDLLILLRKSFPLTTSARTARRRWSCPRHP